MRSAASAALAGAVLAAGAMACDAIIGLSDVPPPPQDAGPDGSHPPLDGGADATAHDAHEASIADAAPDASTSGNDSPTSSDAPSSCGSDSDPRNCGTCRHDCLGGACMAGQCQAFALIGVEAGVSPRALAQDESFLYWTEDLATGMVARTDKTTGATTVISSSTEFPDTVAVDDAGIYWGDSTGIHRCPKTGCPDGGTVTVVNAAAAVGSLAIDDVGIYWSEFSPSVFSAHKYGSMETGNAIWQGDASANQVATDGQRVYFTADDGLLHGVGVDGGGAFAIGALSASGSQGIALESGGVYWTQLATPGTVFAAATQPAPPTWYALAGTQANPFPVASDGVNVYWANDPDIGYASATILECAVGKCTATPLAQGFNAPSAIVVDGVAVYWTDFNATSNGVLWKIAK